MKQIAISTALVAAITFLSSGALASNDIKWQCIQEDSNQFSPVLIQIQDGTVRQGELFVQVNLDRDPEVDYKTFPITAYVDRKKKKEAVYNKKYLLHELDSLQFEVESLIYTIKFASDQMDEKDFPTIFEDEGKEYYKKATLTVQAPVTKDYQEFALDCAY